LPEDAPASAALLLALCHVCDEPLTGETASCHNCDRLFHLRHREDSTGPDCGEVWINEEFLNLEFACDVCLGKRPDAGAEEPPVGHGH
jgi:hypothetical protein